MMEELQPLTQTSHKYRNVLELGYHGYKALEAVRETSEGITSYYYQVVLQGKEVFQSVEESEAYLYYNTI